MHLPASCKFTQNDLNQAKYKDLLPFICPTCGNLSHKTKFVILENIKRHGAKQLYCSRKCFIATLQHGIDIKNCPHCHKTFSAKVAHNRRFCSQACSTTYNNTHKDYGYRRSRLERFLEQQLSILYPNLIIKYNQKETINSELDIYIPSLKIAFELNGIFHYEPIYSEKQLSKIQNNDKRKFQACLEQNIELCIIDTSAQKQFNPETSKKYLDIIINIINLKMAGHEPIEGSD